MKISPSEYLQFIAALIVIFGVLLELAYIFG
jgi:Sec-independent protein secretion pathway component TatC